MKKRRQYTGFHDCMPYCDIDRMNGITRQFYRLVKQGKIKGMTEELTPAELFLYLKLFLYSNGYQDGFIAANKLIQSAVNEIRYLDAKGDNVEFV